MKHLMLTFVALIATSLHLMADNTITACNGKTYKIGDTIRIGKPDLFDYYYCIQKEGTLSINIDIKHRTIGYQDQLIITGIPDYDKKLYEDLGIYERPTSPMIIKAENESGKYYIHLNGALAHGYVISNFHPSIMENSIALSPEILFIYSKKLYGEPITDKDIEIYSQLKNNPKTTKDPFEWQELKTRLRQELTESIESANFNQIFRLKAFSMLGTYDLEKHIFPISRYSYLNNDTRQISELENVGFTLWGHCGFRLANEKSFLNIPVDENIAKGFYGIRKYAQKNEYDRPTTSSILYVRIVKKPVILPNKRTLIDLEHGWSTLPKEFGKRCLDLEIIRVDSYTHPDRIDCNDEMVYNYLGTQK